MAPSPSPTACLAGVWSHSTSPQPAFRRLGSLHLRLRCFVTPSSTTHSSIPIPYLSVPLPPSSTQQLSLIQIPKTESKHLSSTQQHHLVLFICFIESRRQTYHLPSFNLLFIIMRGLIAFSLLPLLASSAPTFSTETIHEGAAPLLSASNAVEIPDSYIVVFKKHVTETAACDHHTWVQDIHLESENQRTELRKRSQFPITTDLFEGIKHTYNIAGNFLGYSGHFDDSVIERVRRHPDVSSSYTTILTVIINPPIQSPLNFDSREP